MTAPTFPFHPAVAQLVTESHRQWVALEYSTDAGASWAALDLTEGTLTWQERRTPRVIGEVTVADPGPDVIAALDPRRYVLGRFTAHYLLPDGSTDAHPVFTGHLRERDTRRPDDALRLVFASKEMLYLDAAAQPLIAGLVTAEPDPTPVDPAGVIADTLAALLWPGQPGDPPALNVTTAPLAPVEAPALRRPDEWEWLQNVADAAGLAVYDDGDQVIQVQPVPTLASTTRAAFAVGAGSTIVSSESRVTREDFANRSTVAFRSRGAGGVDYLTVGVAAITAGPYSPAQAGWCQLDEERQGRPSQAFADRVAATLLRRALSRSRGTQFTAVPHWWLRPGHTVTVQLPAGAQDRHLVTALSFDIAAASMTVTTRYPDDGTDITPGE